MKYSFVLALAMLAGLAACTPRPLSKASMEPRDAVYGQLEDSRFFSGKIAVDKVDYQDENHLRAPLFENAAPALESALYRAHFLASEEKAKYKLYAAIRNVSMPHCFFGYCENGATISYILTDAATENVVYEDLIVVPHTMEYPLFGSDMTLVQRAALGGAVAENYAHLLQLLSRKTKNDFK